MLTTACDAVSTYCCLRAASASMCRLPSNANQANSPVTAATTKAVASATIATSVRFGCLRGGGPGLLTRTLTGLGAATLTPVAGVPLAGPAARDARRRLTGFDADSLSRVATLLPSEPAETVSSAITPALEPTSDQPNSPRAPVCQHRARRRQFHRRGRRTCRSGHRSRATDHPPALRAVGAPRPSEPLRAAVARRRPAGRAEPEALPAQ